MAEELRERLIRGLVKVPILHRLVAGCVSPFFAAAPLPSYAPPGRPEGKPATLSDSSPIFISARFRSGSTLLWQCFSRLDGYTSYYEPFNERQWFNEQRRGDYVDQSHRGVADYASNYEGLDALTSVFDDTWGVRKLSMGANAKAPKMVSFVQSLITAARETPVLQFNRVDFRIPFLRAAFPDAIWIHLSRNPRDTWRSTLRSVDLDWTWNLNSFPPYSKFYLLNWYNDLSLAYPKLWRDPKQTHPYEIHYLIQRLSDLFARRDCDFFLRYEDLEQDLVGQMASLLPKLGYADANLQPIGDLLSPRQKQYDHSRDIQHYEKIEESVEIALKKWLG